MDVNSFAVAVIPLVAAPVTGYLNFTYSRLISKVFRIFSRKAGNANDKVILVVLCVSVALGLTLNLTMSVQFVVVIWIFEPKALEILYAVGYAAGFLFAGWRHGPGLAVATSAEVRDEGT